MRHEYKEECKNNSFSRISIEPMRKFVLVACAGFNFARMVLFVRSVALV